MRSSWIVIHVSLALGATFATASAESPRRLRAMAPMERLNPGGTHAGPTMAAALSAAKVPVAGTRSPAADGSPAAFWLAPPCAGLRTSIVSQSADPRASLATLHLGASTGFQTCRAGDAVRDGRVVFIGTNPTAFEPSVWLERNGALCQSGLLSPQHEAAPAPATAPAPQRRDMRALVGPVRTIPVTRGGKLEGFRISGMRSGSLLTLLGLQNGDVIESFEGKDIATPERALQAYAVLLDRATERLSLGIRRRGAPLVITYRLD